MLTARMHTGQRVMGVDVEGSGHGSPNTATATPQTATVAPGLTACVSWLRLCAGSSRHARTGVVPLLIDARRVIKTTSFLISLPLKEIMRDALMGDRFGR